MFPSFPILLVSAMSTAPPQGGPGIGTKVKQDDKNLDKNYYYCPVYKYPKRTEKYLIFKVKLKGDGSGGSANLPRGVTPAIKWKLMGAALLCSKE
mmetsp:Transcript_44094/g.42768  ORF Transcript_44094/g.42768 Transcript_44094/m.42768 type:complete len:95 (+) Transcript_44094:1129-1413(+)